MPAQTEASIDPSFRPPPPKIDHPDVAAPGAPIGGDWTTQGQQSANSIRAHATGDIPPVVGAEQQAIRRAAGMTPEEAARG